MNTQNLLSQLAAIVGDANVLPDAPEAPATWSARPLATVQPDTSTQVVEIVKVAEAAGIALIPCGAGTQLFTGYPPGAERPYILLSSARLNRILDFQPEDLTVTCEPGTTLDAVQQVVRERRELLALDSPLPERATLGGLVSTNTTGFWRPAYGTPRDLLIGLRAVMTEGVEIKGGGKVVKNVAGYDVCKLFTGAWGTMGFLTELTFKVRTRPEMERVLAWNAPDVATATRAGQQMHYARLAATYVLATNEPDGAPRLILGLHSSTARVDWQTAEFTRLAASAGLTEPPTVLPETEVNALRDRQARNGPDTPLAVRISALLTDLPGLVQTLQTLPNLALTAHCATGVLSLAAPAADPTLIQTVEAQTPKSANRVWTRLDGEFETVACWGETREDFALQRALKQSLDPRSTFSPGRFLGRL